MFDGGRQPTLNGTSANHLAKPAYLRISCCSSTVTVSRISRILPVQIMPFCPAGVKAPGAAERFEASKKYSQRPNALTITSKNVALLILFLVCCTR
jgi:hypothetical protein